jgi:hypothetical protein
MKRWAMRWVPETGAVHARDGIAVVPVGRIGTESMMSGGWFITGTDTGVGKTRMACLLLEALAREGNAPSA